jgi:hypothetical protein
MYSNDAKERVQFLRQSLYKYQEVSDFIRKTA